MTRNERETLVRRLWEWGGTLNGCERRRHEIKRLLSQAGDAEGILRARALTGMPRGDGMGDPTAKAVLMREGALRRVDELTAEINQIMARKAQMDAAVRALPDNLQRLLYMRYVRGWTTSYRIPQMLHADRRTISRWHARALEMLSHDVP